ncbi:MAG TPA: hypothetical protein VFX98_09720 [Longimicrobiaceae bacterium]|nr:hypothetical protein [Longimicrobiaceae bacterium]
MSRERADVVYGVLGAIALLLALFFGVRWIAGSGDGDAPVPRLELLRPADGDTAAQPLEVVFDAGAALRPGPGGWVAGDRHLHLGVGVGAGALMPAPGDLRPAGGTRYAWTLPRLEPGTHALRLFWSDAAHRPLAAGASRAAAVTVR